MRKEHARHSRKVTSTKRWQVLRHEILERDEWKCRRCGERRRLEVDHIKPVRTHPELSFDPRNLQTLCGPCHARKTRIECGHKPKSPERRAWDDAVAELATDNSTPVTE
nr:HNH endonuclease signature motif containing protein [Heliomarina baculiformis]